MICARKKRHHYRKRRSQLDLNADDFSIVNNVINKQIAKEVGSTDCKVVCCRTNHLMTESSSQVIMQTLEKKSDKVPCKVDNVVATVKTRVQDAIFSAVENLVLFSQQILAVVFKIPRKKEPRDFFSVKNDQARHWNFRILQIKKQNFC